MKQIAFLGDSLEQLHAYRKSTRKTPQKDLTLAANRLRAWKG